MSRRLAINYLILTVLLGLFLELSAHALTWIAQAPPGRDPGDLTEAENAAVIANAEPFRPQRLRSVLSK